MITNVGTTTANASVNLGARFTKLPYVPQVPFK
jgi:hypothetical protein